MYIPTWTIPAIITAVILFIEFEPMFRGSRIQSMGDQFAYNARWFFRFVEALILSVVWLLWYVLTS